uniref:Uncharacterized protein n=1 Tax=Anopheles quadriannulatus TaxID=34691 RepID=A0A182XRN2_ANOQN
MQSVEPLVCLVVASSTVAPSTDLP